MKRLPLDLKIWAKVKSKVGSNAAIARSLGEKDKTVQMWEHRRCIPWYAVIPVERISGVSRHDIAPMAYPRDGGYDPTHSQTLR